MNDNDFTELLQYLRGRLRRAGLGSLDERLLSSNVLSAETPSERLLRYLEMLEVEFSLQTDRSQAQLIERLRRVVATESGEPIQGVEVRFSEVDRELYGADRFDLWPTREMDTLVERLRALRSELGDSRDLRLDGP